MTSSTDHSERCAARRHAVVWLTHAPGLWLCYGEPVPRALRRANVVAAIATVLAVVVAVLVTRGGDRWIAGALVWLVGHITWGSYFARHLDAPLRSGAPLVRVRMLQCDATCRRAQHH